MTPEVRRRAIQWLTSSAVLRSTGAVMSWHNPRHPGFEYPEAAGLLLRLLERDERERVASWLRPQLPFVGKAGVAYTFDLGVVLSGLADTSMAATPEFAEAYAALMTAIRSRRATHPEADTRRWSGRFGPHMLKLAIAIRRCESSPERSLRELADAVAGRFDGGPEIYVHAHCYAAEGLLALDDPRAPAAVAWLAQRQRPDGALPSHGSGGPGRADATAQAVRLWCCADRRAYAEPIARGLEYLRGCVGPSGGMRYADDSDDENVWATLFAVQAFDFSVGPADPWCLW